MTEQSPKSSEPTKETEFEKVENVPEKEEEREREKEERDNVKEKNVVDPEKTSEWQEVK